MLNLSNFSVIPLLSLPKEHRAVWSRADVLKPCLDQGTRSLIRCGASTNKVVALAVSVDGLFDVDVDHGAAEKDVFKPYHSLTGGWLLLLIFDS